MSLLSVKNLKVHFPVKQRLFGRSKGSVKAVDGVNFELANGETLGLVGESGCGKSTLGRAVIKLVQPTEGEIVINGRNIANLQGAELREARRNFQMIFQDPIGSLNPRMTVEQIVAEGLRIHYPKESRAKHREQVGDLLKDVGLDASHAQRYPHEFSGGQRQRIGIARALALKPKLIVCDEPVSALDVSVQAQIVNLLSDLQKEHGLAYLFIAHDLAVVGHISQRIMEMYLGKVMEIGPAAKITRAPRHPYTQALVSAVPVIDPAKQQKRLFLKGEVPSPINPPSGCPFHTRCPLAQEICNQQFPPYKEITPGQFAACHFAEQTG
ncbi:MAG: ABC transporter ATP-binding protein [Verrucomicrobiales bacterium]